MDFLRRSHGKRVFHDIENEKYFEFGRQIILIESTENKANEHRKKKVATEMFITYANAIFNFFLQWKYANDRL